MRIMWTQSSRIYWQLQSQKQEKIRDDHTEPRIVDVGIVHGEQKEVAEQEGRNMDGKVVDVCNVVALEAIPLETNDVGPSTSISSPALLDFEKMLRMIPNSDGLKQLLDVSVNWAGLCAKKHRGEVASADGDDQKAEFSTKVQEMYKVLRVVTNLKGGAGVLAAMAPDLLEMAHTFASMIPSVLEAAMGFEKFASPILSLLEERVKQQEELVAMEDEVAKTRDLNKELVQELKAIQHKLAVLVVTPKPKKTQNSPLNQLKTI